MRGGSILLCTIFITFVFCADKPLQEFSEGNEQFSVDVVKAIFNDEHENIIISPLSVELVLSLLAEGAVGETYDELKKALHLPSKEGTATGVKELLPILTKSNEDFNLSVADKLNINNTFHVKKEFEDFAVSVYQSEVEKVNFADRQKAAELINDWVAKKTNNKILNLIEPDQLSDTTALVLVNALYLNAKWVTPFRTVTKQKFHFLKKEAGDVDMMHSPSQAKYLYFHCGFLKAKFLEIPYKNSNVSATFILPDAKDGIKDLEKNVELYFKPHKLTLQNVAVSLPTFSTTTEQDFKDILISLGASKVFTPQADLSGISDQHNLYVNFVQQKAFINITVNGTEAAAATAGGLTPTIALPPPNLTFNADHPFFFFIRESTSKAILFVGRFQ